MLALLLLVQTAVSGAVVEGKGSPTAEVPRLEATVQIDGVLDEPVWSQATRLGGFWQYQPVDGRPAEEETEVLVWYAPDAIYFGIVAHDRQPAAIRATVADRDNIDSDDHVVIDIDTFHDRRRAFFFGVNPLGAQSDGVRSEGAGQVSSLIPGSTDLNPDFTWDSKGRITDRGYEVEIRIPFKSLRYPGGQPQSWGFNVTRVVQRTGYTDTWTDVRRANASFLGQEGAIGGLHDLKRGVAVEAQPFVTATADGSRDDATGEFIRDDLNPDAGLNLRLGFTSYALDATINPDFSQVESDEGQVTVNERFALFFPEKRPFFLEGIELFGSPQTLVYTRRIVNPKVGAKLTGKFGQLGVAHLTAVDETDAGDAWFNITRLRRDFGRNSIAGVTFTNRDQGSLHNRVLAGDFRYVWGLYYTQFQLGASVTHDAAGSRTAPIWQAEYDRTGRSWGFNYLREGARPRLRRPGGVREPAPERRGQRARLQPIHDLRRARGGAGESHRLLRPRPDLALPGLRLQPGPRGLRAVRRHLPAPRRVGAQRTRPARLRELPGLELRRLHRGERRRSRLPSGGRLLRLRVADGGDDADLAAAGSQRAATSGAARRSSRKARPARRGS